MDVRDSTFTSNQGGVTVWAIFGTATFTRLTFRDNIGGSAFGGADMNLYGALATISECRFSNSIGGTGDAKHSGALMIQSASNCRVLDPRHGRARRPHRRVSSRIGARVVPSWCRSRYFARNVWSVWNRKVSQAEGIASNISWIMVALRANQTRRRRTDTVARTRGGNWGSREADPRGEEGSRNAFVYSRMISRVLCTRGALLA